MKLRYKLVIIFLISLSIYGYMRPFNVPILSRYVIIPYYKHVLIPYRNSKLNEARIERSHKDKLSKIEHRHQLHVKAQAGDKKAIVDYANSFLSSSSPAEPYNWDEAYPLLLKAHQEKVIDALYFFLFYQNKGNEEKGLNPYYDLKKSLDSLEKSAQEGSEAAQSLLANLYETGYSYGLEVEPDPIKGLAWRVNSMFKGKEKVLINELNYVREDYILAHLKRDNIQDEAAARALIEEYARLYPVTTFLEVIKGSSMTSEQEKIRSEKRAKRRADVESGNVNAIITYADMLMQGVYGVVDWNTAHDLLTNVHELGSSEGTFYLYFLYTSKGRLETGLNPFYNIKKGLKYLELAALKGNADAQNKLVIAYEKGFYGPVDRLKGMAWRVISHMNDKNEVIALDRRFTVDQFLNFYSLTEEEIKAVHELIKEYRAKFFSDKKI